MAEMHNLRDLPHQELFGAKESSEKEASLLRNLRRCPGCLSRAALTQLLPLFMFLGLFLFLATILVQVSRLHQPPRGSTEDQQWNHSLEVVSQQLQSNLEFFHQKLAQMNVSLAFHLHQQRDSTRDQQWSHSLEVVSQQLQSNLEFFHQKLAQMNVSLVVLSQQVQKDMDIFHQQLAQMNVSLASHLHQQRDSTRDQQWSRSLEIVSQQIMLGLEGIHQQLAQINASLAGPCHSCPLNWEPFQGSCYFFLDTKKNWKMSQSTCQDWKAHLKFLQSWRVRNKKKAWIGLTDQHNEGSWHWVDGSPLQLSFWSRGEPNNAGDEDCVELQDDGWNDGLCNLEHASICEKQAFPCPKP
ncbi:CD209 antigen-like isoform X2 [Erinaceus europaeus]|uniref:CD209 antigen-like isoform X2 n=1 Tax=Erinaceus europaeus TaxID=9365 RepID=A0ABM3WLF7_ERIEU|nr:CD209 antigen-like isoform X2 [Erinaceus europaeus]